jgi:hypothetical protein
MKMVIPTPLADEQKQAAFDGDAPSFLARCVPYAGGCHPIRRNRPVARIFLADFSNQHKIKVNAFHANLRDIGIERVVRHGRTPESLPFCRNLSRSRVDHPI